LEYKVLAVENFHNWIFVELEDNSWIFNCENVCYL